LALCSLWHVVAKSSFVPKMDADEMDVLIERAFAKLDVELDAQLFMSLVEESNAQGEEQLIAAAEDLLRVSNLERDVSVTVLVDVLTSVGFLEKYIENVAANRVVKVGERCFALVKDEWYRGTVDSIVERGEEKNVLYTVTLDSFVGTQYVKREQLSMDWEMSADGGDDGEGKCELCERQTRVTAHHLRPKEVHNKYLKKGFTRAELAQCAFVCRPCHSAIHRAASNDELAKDWYNIELLRTNASVMRFVYDWLVLGIMLLKDSLMM
jgi:hypothetical protein